MLVIGFLYLGGSSEAEAAGTGLVEWRGTKMAAETVELHKLKVL